MWGAHPGTESADEINVLLATSTTYCASCRHAWRMNVEYVCVEYMSSDLRRFLAHGCSRTVSASDASHSRRVGFFRLARILYASGTLIYQARAAPGTLWGHNAPLRYYSACSDGAKRCKKAQFSSLGPARFLAAASWCRFRSCRSSARDHPA